ncbi:MAG: DUF6119 family protein, partial [Lentilitoribacter sp.]
MARKTYTLSLGKPDVVDFDQILSESARGKFAEPSTQIINAADFGDGARLYIFVGAFNTPAWLKDIRNEFDVPGRIQNRSSSAVLVFRKLERVFVATFAHGWMYLDESNVEGDFGLRVALNALDDKKLNRLDRANLGDALRAISLSPFQRDFSSFGVDDALDLVRKVGGAARDASSADAISGARALKISGDFLISNLPDLAEEALEFYNSNHYQQTSFKIIDVVSPVADSRMVAILDAAAAENI